MTTGISPAAPPRERATPSTRTSGTARAPTRAAPIPAPARTWGPTPPTSRGTSPKPATYGERGAPAAAPAGACSTPSSIRSAACSAAGGCEAASPLHLKNTGLGLCGLPQPKACLSLWICRYSALSPSAGAGDSAGWGRQLPLHCHAPVDGGAHGVELGLIVGHHPLDAVPVEVVGDLGGLEAPAGNLHGKNRPALSVLKWISPPSGSTWRYLSRKFRWVSRRLAWRLVGQGSQKLI